MDVSTTDAEIQRLRDGHALITAAVHGLSIQVTDQHGTVRLLAQSVDNTTRNVDRMAISLNGLPEALDHRYASRARFEIVEKVVFGATALILVAFITSLLVGWPTRVYLPQRPSETALPRP